jgi:hypothetical protein
MKRVAIVQSCYIPWKGYFDLIAAVDEFILFDDRQYTRRDWRNRNKIKTREGAQWLTIPVQTKGRYEQRIDETLVSDPRWSSRHWKTIVANYAAAPHFDVFRELFARTYEELSDEPYLSRVNRRLLEVAAEALGITTRLTWSTEYETRGSKTDRLVSLCEAAGATEYVSGPRARAYLDEERFAERGIDVCWFDYAGYPEYPQLHPPFEHAVTVLDLIFNTGKAATSYMKAVEHGP